MIAAALLLMAALPLAGYRSGFLPRARRQLTAQPTQPLAEAAEGIAPDPATLDPADQSAFTPLTAPDYTALKASIEVMLRGKGGTYGIYVEDLATGMRFGVNPDLEFVAASTIKVPLVLFLYQEADAGRTDLGTAVAIEARDYEGGTGHLQYEALGTRYTLKELARFTLVESDNVATQMLIRYLGRENFRAFVRSLGAFITPDRENVTSPRDMATFFKALLDFQKKSPALAGEIMDSLLHTAFTDRLPALLPKDLPVAHKIGNQVRVMNDAGIVYVPGRPYIISVFTQDADEGQAVATIAQISKRVYDYQASLR